MKRLLAMAVMALFMIAPPLYANAEILVAKNESRFSDEKFSEKVIRFPKCDFKMMFEKLFGVQRELWTTDVSKTSILYSFLPKKDVGYSPAIMLTESCFLKLARKTIQKGNRAFGYGDSVSYDFILDTFEAQIDAGKDTLDRPLYLKTRVFVRLNWPYHYDPKEAEKIFDTMSPVKFQGKMLIVARLGGISVTTSENIYDFSEINIIITPTSINVEDPAKK